MVTAATSPLPLVWQTRTAQYRKYDAYGPATGSGPPEAVAEGGALPPAGPGQPCAMKSTRPGRSYRETLSQTNQSQCCAALRSNGNAPNREKNSNLRPRAPCRPKPAKSHPRFEVSCNYTSTIGVFQNIVGASPMKWLHSPLYGCDKSRFGSKGRQAERCRYRAVWKFRGSSKPASCATVCQPPGNIIKNHLDG